MSGGHELALALEWIIATAKADSALMSLVGGVYRSRAAADVSTPFVVAAFQSGQDSTTMNEFRLMTQPLFQIKAVGPVTQMAAIVSAAGRIDTLFGTPPTSGSVAGAAILACWRESPLQMDEDVNGEQWHNLGGLYRLQIQQTS